MHRIVLFIITLLLFLLIKLVLGLKLLFSFIRVLLQDCWDRYADVFLEIGREKQLIKYLIASA